MNVPNRPNSPDFIFMLTRNDRTIANAGVHLETALAAGVRHIGFKDIGLDTHTLAKLTARLRAAGAVSYLEVVSMNRDDEMRSIDAGIQLGVDNILGGVNVAAALPRLAGRKIGYFPFVGRVHGHPGVLEGSADDIAASAAELTRHLGITGIDLLAWRNTGDVPAMIEAACRATTKPVIVAGSIDRPYQIAALKAAGAAAFTVGTAALEGRFPAKSVKLKDQLEAILLCNSTADELN
jgi:hypothetical protein